MTNPDEIKPPKRRWFRPSVRALMVVVLLMAVGLGWVVHRARVQREAVAAIEKTGGKVSYDWQIYPAGGVNPAAQPKWPRWLVERFGMDYFSHVAVVFLGKTAGNAEMEHVGRLSRLKFFHLTEGAQFTDKGAAQLAGLNDLESVSFAKSNVTGASLASLRDKTKLKHLFINDLPIVDDDLAALRGLNNLEILDLDSTRITDAGLAHLEGLVKMRQLRLRSTPITGPGLAHLRGMTQLRNLMLYGSKVRDLSALPDLPAMEFILLDGTPLDDDGLAKLPELPAIKSFFFRKTAVSDAGVAKLLRYKQTLTGLAAGGPKITDAVAPTLLKLEKLSTILLDGSPGVTDATLDQLSALKGLKTINVDQTSTTPEGLARLGKAVPGVRTMKGVADANRARSRAAPKAQAKKAGAQP